MHPVARVPVRSHIKPPSLLGIAVVSYFEEAGAFREWLLRAAAGSPSQLQIMYGVAGERRLPEEEIPWLPGYEQSRPVRLGNLAYQQRQLDVYGELLDAMHRCWRSLPPAPHAWQLERALVEFLETIWEAPDEGIWEVRGPRRHFTHSKVMAWVALDRAIKGVESFGFAGPVDRWRELRARIHAEVCEKGFSPARGAFTQFYGGAWVTVHSCLKAGWRRSAGATAVGAGDDLQVVAVGVAPVDPAAAVVMVDLAGLVVARVGPVRQSARADAAEDGVEFGFADEERVVLPVHLAAHAHEVEGDPVVDLDPEERPERNGSRHSQDLREEARRCARVAGRYDGVIELDGHGATSMAGVGPVCTVGPRDGRPLEAGSWHLPSNPPPYAAG
jgi:hypothetical protein